MAHDVFISHAHKDKGIADTICEKLESAQVRCWIAERDISAGEDWTEAIRNAIGSSRVMVLVLSENANAATHIQREIAHAFYTKRIIIPLRLTDTPPRRSFLSYLGTIRCFDVFSPTAEQPLEALTARIKSMVRGRTLTRDAMLDDSATETTRTLNLLNSGIGALPASNYPTLGILKSLAIAASLFAVVWFVPWQTRHEVSPATDNRHSTDAGRSASLDSFRQATGDISVSKPAYTYSRFGSWAVPNTDPTPSVQQGPQDTPSITPAAQPTTTTPSARSDVDQTAAGEVESLRAHDSASAKSLQENPARIINRRDEHRGKSRPKGHNVRVSASERLRFAKIKSRLRALWRQFVARNKEIGNR